MEECSVYILKSLARNYIYVGLSNDVGRRFAEHQMGKERTTRAYRPFKLLHVERFKTGTEAGFREKYLKSGFGKEWIKETPV